MECCKCVEFGWDKPEDVFVSNLADKKSYCLLHAPADLKLEQCAEFTDLFEKRIEHCKDMQEDEGICVLSGVVFPENVTIEANSQLPPISFQGARFEGYLYANRVVFNGDTVFEGCHFELGCHFSGSQFTGDINFANVCIEQEAAFEGALFEQTGHFMNTIFKSTAHFNSAKFERSAIFTNSSFGGQAQFQKVRIKGQADFSHSYFEAHAWFNDSLLMRSAFFTKADFKADVSFFCADFVERTFWVGASLQGEAHFIKTGFHSGGDFSKALFKESVLFDHSCAISLMLFRETIFEQGLEFDKLQLDGRLRFDETNFGRAVRIKSLHGTERAAIEISNCLLSFYGFTFYDSNPTICDLTQQQDVANIHFINSSWVTGERIRACTEEDSLQLTRDLYQRMKAKYKSENNEYEASQWHIAEKEALLKLMRQNGESKLFLGILLVYKFSSGFGEKPVHAFWVLVGILLLPLLFLAGLEVSNNFTWWNIDPVKVDKVVMKWLHFIPLTKVSGIFKNGWSLAFIAFWQLVVSLQAALFVFALRNRFRR